MGELFEAGSTREVFDAFVLDAAPAEQKLFESCERCGLCEGFDASWTDVAAIEVQCFDLLKVWGRCDGLDTFDTKVVVSDGEFCEELHVWVMGESVCFIAIHPQSFGVEVFGEGGMRGRFTVGKVRPKSVESDLPCVLGPRGEMLEGVSQPVLFVVFCSPAPEEGEDLCKCLL